MQILADYLGLSRREANLAAAGFILVAIGAFFAVMNWLCLKASLQFKKSGVDRHVSMVPTFGICLAFGFLLIAPLNWHARWIWIFDPSALMLIISIPLLLRQIIEQFK